MSVLKRLITRLEELSRDNVLKTLVIREQEFIENLNRDQLAKGQRSDNTFLPPYRKNNPSKTFGNNTVSKTAGEPIKLLDTGAFYKSIDVKVTDNAFLMTGDTQKGSTNLSERYGDSILGLSKESLGKLRIKLKQDILIELRRI